MAKQFALRESAALQCGSVDESRPVLPHVRILGWYSGNKRRYLPESVEPALYQGIKSNLNHTDGPSKQRVVQERFGWFDNITKEADGLYGDYHYNPELPYSKAFAWWAKNKPDMLGMSHDAVGTGRTENGVFIVEKVVSIKAVDVVADPATTKGLYESLRGLLEAMDTETPPAEPNELGDLESHIQKAVAAICGDEGLDLKEKVKKIKAALKLLEEPEEEVEEEDEEDEDGPKPKGKDKEEEEYEESLQALAKKEPGVRKLLEKLDRVETTLKLRERNELAHRLCQEAKLPAVAVTATFLSLLLEAKDEPAMKKLIEDRKQIVSIQRPTSTGPIPGGKGAAIDNKDFAKAIREGRR